jgi:phosphatidylserine/phosphatidylglycerophosphate/cardiolipin synthase-like enzyme
MRALPDIGNTLVKQLDENPDLRLIVITNRTEDIQKDIRQGWFRRRQFYQRLCADHPDRVMILQYKKDHHPYIHSKTWIFDDEFALIGSANCNRRSFSYDTETAVGVAGMDPDGRPFAQNLRRRLWLTHLTPAVGQPARSLSVDLDDWQAALAALIAPDSRLEGYNMDAGEDDYPQPGIPLGKPGDFIGDLIWNWVIDPDGT